MDLKVVVLLLCLCALAIPSTEGGIPTCCVRTSRIPVPILMKVEKVVVQRNNGVCDIDALVLFVNGKKYCADPRVKRFLKIQKARKKKRSS